ncbi:MAG TPA: hypothetical protein VHQ47_18065 [Phycisphaerae bacterium]|jgi:hypothetical protein|nr:hypothetical protein [Phycisphaerae bacterium]
MTTFKAHFDGKAIIPDEPVDFPLNEPLTIQVVAPVTPERSITGAELANSPFAGLWKDRTDIGDSVEFARKLRRQAETRQRD